ncbi:hypothetical protein DSM110093_03132 [Sulfitobacter sp. DSM 110093]|nr:hypothetical protein DSM110093_03132 [Sulfitobacter sp. DSM 110093]
MPRFSLRSLKVFRPHTLCAEILLLSAQSTQIVHSACPLKKAPASARSPLVRSLVVNYGPTLPAEPPGFTYQSNEGPAEVRMRSRISVNNAEAYIAAARVGISLIQIPVFDVRDLLENGELVQVLSDLTPPSMQLSLLYAQRRNVPARIVAFQE